MELLATEAWRTRLSEAEPLRSDLARRASPALAADLVRERFQLLPGAPVHVFRLYHLRSDWRSRSSSHRRGRRSILTTTTRRCSGSGATGRRRTPTGGSSASGPSFESVWLASRAEAEAVTPRTGLQTAIVPNAVGHQSRVERAARDPEGPLSLLFVGNLAYWPNIEAAEVLAERVLPAVRRLVSGPVQVMLVGRFEADSPILGLGELEGVRAVGYADDLRAHYAASRTSWSYRSTAPARHQGARGVRVRRHVGGFEVLGASGLGAVDGAAAPAR